MNDDAQNESTEGSYSTPITFEKHIEEAEKNVIRKGRAACDATKAQPLKNTFGLAFSGGGIRSATFNLGVLQGLAETGLLKRIDYLSTVSGGGYIGSWFSALLHRKAAGEQTTTSEGKVAEALKKLQDELNPNKQGVDKSCDAAQQTTSTPPNGKVSLQWLRRYSSYLTPRSGLFGLDFLAALAGLFRNLLLNQAILICLLMATLTVPYFLMKAGEWLVATDRDGNFFYLLVCASGAALSFAILDIVWGLTALRSGNAIRAVLTAFVAACVAALIFHFNQRAPVASFSFLPALGGLLYFLIWCASSELEGFKSIKYWKSFVLPLFVTSIALGGLLYGYDKLLEYVPADLLGAFSLILGPALLIQILCMAAIVHTGLVGRGYSEINREWLGRAGGQVFALEVAWVVFTSLALLSPALVDYLNGWVAYGGGVAWAFGSIATFWLSHSNKSGEKKSNPLLEKGLSVAPYLVVLGLIIVLSTGLHKGFGVTPSSCQLEKAQLINFTVAIQDKKFDNFESPPVCAKPSLHKSVANTLREDSQIKWLSLAGALSIFLFVGSALARRVDINIFSMHQFYRDRLARAYLGASNNKRNPNPFTDFDECDDLALSELARQRPVHLVNTTLNLTEVTDNELQWQERRGASFLFSPHYCGYQLSPRPDHQYYVSTGEYMQSTLPGQNGVMLGTAVAVSGAAASPNMGYHSSPPLAFLMTFFNVRLGRWCPNPAKKEIISEPSPKEGLSCLLRELFGATNEKTEYLNLTDGGHFENLGIYELVRRQCKVILVSDAGADDMEGFKFEDLGNAIQKCRVDFGVEIKMYGMEKLKPRKAQSRVAWGHITYPETEGKEKKYGVLIYLKPLMRGDEPVDVYHYAATNDDFPHQSTSDQWFDESQFESYRELGLITVKEMLRKIEEGNSNDSCDTFVNHTYDHIHKKFVHTAQEKPL